MCCTLLRRLTGRCHRLAGLTSRLCCPASSLAWARISSLVVRWSALVGAASLVGCGERDWGWWSRHGEFSSWDGSRMTVFTGLRLAYLDRHGEAMPLFGLHPLCGPRSPHPSAGRATRAARAQGHLGAGRLNASTPRAGRGFSSHPHNSRAAATVQPSRPWLFIIPWPGRWRCLSSASMANLRAM